VTLAGDAAVEIVKYVRALVPECERVGAASFSV
jgi:hypothetical protein